MPRVNGDPRFSQYNVKAVSLSMPITSCQQGIKPLQNKNTSRVQPVSFTPQIFAVKSIQIVNKWYKHVLSLLNKPKHGYTERIMKDLLSFQDPLFLSTDNYVFL